MWIYCEKASNLEQCLSFAAIYDGWSIAATVSIDCIYYSDLLTVSSGSVAESLHNRRTCKFFGSGWCDKANALLLKVFFSVAPFALIARCCQRLAFSSQGTVSPSPTGRAFPFLRHLLLILSCLIRDLGGSSRSSGCEDDKWIASLEKWTQIHPLQEICVHIHALFFLKDNGWHGGGDFEGAAQNSNK